MVRIPPTLRAMYRACPTCCGESTEPFSWTLPLVGVDIDLDGLQRLVLNSLFLNLRLDRGVVEFRRTL